jgi:hypothetical protein
MDRDCFCYGRCYFASDELCLSIRALSALAAIRYQGRESGIPIWEMSRISGLSDTVHTGQRPLTGSKLLGKQWTIERVE